MEEINIDKELKELSSARITKKDIFIDLLRYKVECEELQQENTQLRQKQDEVIKHCEARIKMREDKLFKNDMQPKIEKAVYEEIKSMLVGEDIK